MIRGVNHITISVRSIDSAFHFYGDVLGLVPVMKSPRSAYFKAGDTWIALNMEQDHMPSKSYAHLAFDVRQNEFGSFVEDLRRKGILEWQTNATEGGSIYILDDSGNKLEIHCSTLHDRVKHGKEEWGRDVHWFDQEETEE